MNKFISQVLIADDMIYKTEQNLFASEQVAQQK